MKMMTSFELHTAPDLLILDNVRLIKHPGIAFSCKFKLAYDSKTENSLTNLQTRSGFQLLNIGLKQKIKKQT